MSSPAEIVRAKLSEVLRWERRKRREQALASLVCSALVAALLALPLYPQIAPGSWRWFVPLLALLAGAPLFILRGRWRRADSVRALAFVDKRLRLDERVLTSWDVLERAEQSGAALLVLEQTAQHIDDLKPRAAFARKWPWQAYFIMPLAVLWAGLLWLDVPMEFGKSVEPARPTLARALDEFSRDLLERAKNEQLPETLRLGRELEEMAQKGIAAKADDEKVRSELDGLMKKIELAEKSAAAPGGFGAGESRRQLSDLQAELEAARDILGRPEAEPAGEGQRWLDGLSALPQLKRRFDQDPQSRRSLSPGELKSVLEKMQEQVTGELDRRALLDARQFLEQMARQAPGSQRQANARADGAGEESSRDDGVPGRTDGSRPGKEAGEKPDGTSGPPQFGAGPATQLEGLLGAGPAGGIPLKGKPAGGESATTEKEVVASYRRQAEAELNSERVPEALKETIRNYFLSLDDAARHR